MNRTQRKLRVLSLFSGCGGLDLGLEGGFHPPAAEFLGLELDSQGRLPQNPMETVFANDILQAARTIWEFNFNRKAIFSLESIVDLVKTHRRTSKVFPKNIDIVTGGFPCQDFSVAGKRNGFSSNKSHLGIHPKGTDSPSQENRGMLYWWMREVISITQPKLFVAENVKGLTSLGDALEIIRGDFESISNGGYIVIPPKVLNAKHYGVPQNRERIIFIGVRRDQVDWETSKRLQSGELDLYPPATHSDCDPNLLPTITTRQALMGLEEPETSSDPSQVAFSGAKWMGNHCQGQTEINPDGVAPTIRSEHHGNIEFRRLSQTKGGKWEDELNKGLPQRRLSVRECATLQSFPASFSLVGKGLVSPTWAYKVIGNAVPPLLAFHIGKHISEKWSKIFIQNSGSTKLITTKSF